MRIKAFSLIEIIVVIVLIGTIFSLVLTAYSSKKNENKKNSIKDISVHVKEDATIYIYGENCENTIIELPDGFYANSPNYGYKEDNIVQKKNALDSFEEVDFGTHKIIDKKETICFKLNFKNSNFYEKFIISTKIKHYVLSPFYQKIEEFETLEDAKKYFISDELFPKSLDDYYHE